MAGKRVRKLAATIAAPNGVGEPTLNPMDYNSSLVRALNYYNAEADNKKKRKYVLDYSKKHLKNIALSDDLPDHLFSTIGALARLVIRGEPLEAGEVEQLDSTIKALSDRSKDLVKVAKDNSKKIKAQQDAAAALAAKKKEFATESRANDLIEHLEQSIDELIVKATAGTIEFTMASVDSTDKKAVDIFIDHATKRLDEFTEVSQSDDEQIIEGYSHINRRKMNHLLKMIQGAIDEVKTLHAQIKTQNQKTRKQRAKKVKPPQVIAKNVKYLAKSDELNLESIPPADLIGLHHAVLYNVKTRKIIIINALPNESLTFKGTTIVGLDPATSQSKTLRKPAEQLKDFVKATRRNAEVAFKAIKTTPREANGRVNADMLIIAVNRVRGN